VTALDFTLLTCCTSLWLSRAGRVNQRTVRSTPAGGQIQCLPSDLEPSDETSVQGGYDVQGQIDLEGDESLITHSKFGQICICLEKQWESSGVEWTTALCANGP